MSKRRRKRKVAKAAPKPLDPTVHESGNVSPFTVAGAPGTAVYGGYVLTNESDDRLVGTDLYKTYSNMLLNTSIVASGVRYFCNLVAKAAWTVDPADIEGAERGKIEKEKKRRKREAMREQMGQGPPDLEPKEEEPVGKVAPPPPPGASAEPESPFQEDLEDLELELPPEVQADKDQAEEIAEKVKDIMQDMSTPFHRVIRRACMYTMYGFSIQEWVAKKNDDGSIGFEDIEPRPQKTIERWDVDTSGNVLGVWQRNPQNYEEQYIPRDKCIYLVDDTYNDSPEGMGLFRHLVKTASELRQYELLEAWGFETDLRGIPIARGPLTEISKMVQRGTITQAQADSLLSPMTEFLESHNRSPELGMLLDSMTYQTTDERSAPSSVRQWDVELLTGDPGTAKDIAAAIERKNRELARILGVEHLLLGSDSVGSHALADSKTGQFLLLLDACLKELKEVFEDDFLDPLFDLNGWDKRYKPKFKVEKLQYRDVLEVVEALKQLSMSGLSSEDKAVNVIRENLGLPDAPQEDDLDLSLVGPLFGNPPERDKNRIPDVPYIPKPEEEESE